METQAKALKFLEENGFYFASNPQQTKIADNLVRSGVFRTIPNDWGFSKTEGFYVAASVVNKNHMPMSLKSYCDGLNELKLHEFVQFEMFQKGREHGAVSVLAQICDISGRLNGKLGYEVAILGTNEVVYTERESLKRTFLV